MRAASHASPAKTLKNEEVQQLKSLHNSSKNDKYDQDKIYQSPKYMNK